MSDDNHELGTRTSQFLMIPLWVQYHSRIRQKSSSCKPSELENDPVMDEILWDTYQKYGDFSEVLVYQRVPQIETHEKRHKPASDHPLVFPFKSWSSWPHFSITSPSSPPTIDARRASRGFLRHASCGSNWHFWVDRNGFFKLCNLGVVRRTDWCFGTWLDYDFRIILGMSSSQLTLTPSFFRGVGQPQTRGYCGPTCMSRWSFREATNDHAESCLCCHKVMHDMLTQQATNRTWAACNLPCNYGLENAMKSVL